MSKNKKGLIIRFQAVETNEERNRRHAAEAPGRGSFDGYSEDGVPVRNKKYQHYKRDRQGRVRGPKQMVSISLMGILYAVFLDFENFLGKIS